MRIEAMRSPKSGRAVANQLLVYDDEGGVYFWSYETVIAYVDKNADIYLDFWFWNYSSTTDKYRNIFLGVSTQDVMDMIAREEIRWVTLNKKDDLGAWYNPITMNIPFKDFLNIEVISGAKVLPDYE